MEPFAQTELHEAARAITSALHKSEKAILKLKESSPQYRLTEGNIRAFHLALVLIEHEQGLQEAQSYSAGACAEAQASFSSMIARVEKILPKFVPGTPQHTLAVRRIRAFEIAGEMIQRELTADYDE